MDAAPKQTAKRLEGKTALITGGSTGIGYATAKLFLEHGAKVILTGQNPDRLKAAKEKLKAGSPSGAQVSGVLADSASLEQLSALAETTKEKFEGRLDILFLNAGVLGKEALLEQVEESEFDHIFNVNVKGTFFTLQKLSPLLASGSSVIFNISTIHSKGGGGSLLYAASKAACRSLVRSASHHLAARGVRVNSVSPGFVPDTKIFVHISDGDGKFAYHDLMIDAIPLKRPGQLDEIANTVLFLASDESSYMTGSDIIVDGGFSA